MIEVREIQVIARLRWSLVVCLDEIAAGAWAARLADESNIWNSRAGTSTQPSTRGQWKAALRFT